MMIRNLISVIVALLASCNALPPMWSMNSRENKHRNNRDNHHHDHPEMYGGGDSSLLQQATQTPQLLATTSPHPQWTQAAEIVVPPTGWKKAVFDAHNNARLEHCVPELTWDNTMADYAQDRAEGLCFSGKFQHYSDPGNGENTYMSWGMELSSDMSTHGTTGVAAWPDLNWPVRYAERNQHNYNYSTFNSAALQFTQMVWASSEKIGCGMATCDSSNGLTMVLSCSYYPAVNFSGSFPDNIRNPASCGRRRTTVYPDIHDGPAACECSCHMDDTAQFRLRVLMDKLPELII